MKQTLYILALILTIGCTETEIKTASCGGLDIKVHVGEYEIPDSLLLKQCVQPPLLLGLSAADRNLNQHFEIPDTLTYCFAKESTFNEEDTRKLIERKRECFRLSQDSFKTVFHEIDDWDSADQRIGLVRGDGSWQYPGKIIFHASLKGLRTQNLGWWEEGCRVDWHEDHVHLAGYGHMHNHLDRTLVIDSVKYEEKNGVGSYSSQFFTYTNESFRNYPYEGASLGHYGMDDYYTIFPSGGIPTAYDMTAQDWRMAQDSWGKPKIEEPVIVDPCEDEGFMALYSTYVRSKQSDLKEYEKYRDQIEIINIQLLTD